MGLQVTACKGVIPAFVRGLGEVRRANKDKYFFIVLGH